jgi:hypothetical protein
MACTQVPWSNVVALLGFFAVIGYGLKLFAKSLSEG